MAYQGYARGLGRSRVNAVHQAALDDFKPDLTILFDMDPVMAMKRVETRGEEISRFDAESIEFHKTLRAAFNQIAVDNPDRIRTVNADATRDSVATQILSIIVGHYPNLAGQLKSRM